MLSPGLGVGHYSVSEITDTLSGSYNLYCRDLTFKERILNNYATRLSA